MSESNNLTVEQKFAKVMLQLRVLRPFYSAVYEVMMKKQDDSVPTIGVTTNTLVYNHDFVNNISFPEFVFIVLHEIGHIALMHVARRENRDAKIWNIACDLYVNQILAMEFGMAPGKCVNKNGIDIMMPMSGLYCSSLDPDVDYAEKIYEEIFDSINSLSGTSGETAYYIGSKTDCEKDKYYRFEINIDGDSENDLIDNGEDQSMKRQESEKIVSDATVRSDMSSSGYSGDGGGLLKAVKNMLKSELDWRKLLRKYLISSCSTDSSFSRPDKRMYYQKSIYPGQVVDELNAVKGVKVCIDTSGSISDDDIAYFCGQVYDLTKKFKIDAELIYWDASIQTTGQFSGYKEFERVSVYGGGGTDPKCIFEYLDSKKCIIKPVVTLIFTDGYFSTDNITKKQMKKYKDTIWIMTRNHNNSFEPPFGRKALARFS